MIFCAGLIGIEKYHSQSPLNQGPFYQRALRYTILETASYYKNPYFGERFDRNQEYGKPNLLEAGKLPDEFGSYKPEDFILRTDSFGFLKTSDQSDPFAKSEDLKILFIGGSNTAGWGAPANESIPSFVHEELLKQGIKNHVINGGVNGYGSIQEFFYYALELVNLNPDLVVFLDGYNDNWANGAYAPSLRVFEDSKQIKKIFREIFPNISARYFSDEEEPLFFTDLKAKYEFSMKSVIKNSLGVSLARNIFSIFILQPELSSKDPSRYSNLEKQMVEHFHLKHDMTKYQKIESYYESLKKEYEKSSVVFLNYLRIFDNDSKNHYFDFIHYSSEGHREIAKNLSLEIKKQFPKIKQLKLSRSF